MSTYTCQRCGDEYTIARDGDDPFTTITASFHDDDREDFSESVCQDCGDELLADVYGALEVGLDD
jgi:hypothetical protein